MLAATFRDCLNHGLKDSADYGNSIALTILSLDRNAHPTRSHFRIALDEIVQVRPKRTVSYT